MPSLGVCLAFRSGSADLDEGNVEQIQRVFKNHLETLVEGGSCNSKGLCFGVMFPLFIT